MTLSFSHVAWAPLRAVWQPRRMFREAVAASPVPWWYPPVIIGYCTVGDVFVHVYCVYGRWVFQLFPQDWVVGTVGYILYNVNAWLLTLAVLAVVHLAVRGPLRHSAPLALVSFYFIGGVAWIVWLVDLLHWVLRVPPLVIRLPDWLGLSSPVLGLGGRFSHLVAFPWAGVALWIICRDVIGLRRRRQQAAAFLGVVLLPLAGRLAVEQLPNLSARLLWYRLGWPVPLGWVVLLTHLSVTVVVSGLLWRLFAGSGSGAAGR